MLQRNCMLHRFTTLLSNVKAPPMLSFALFLCMSFYSFYFIKSRLLSLVMFFIFFIISLCCIIYNIILIKKRKKQNKMIYLLLIFSLSIVFASIAYHRFIISNLPPITLAKTKDIEKIKVILGSDAIPSGKKYYKANAKILNCTYKDGSSFSCKNEIILFIPSIFIKQNYMGGVSLKRGALGISSFSKGAILEVEGIFSKKDQKEGMLYSKKRFFVFQNSNVEFISWESRLYAGRAHARFFINRLLYSWKEAGSFLLALTTANKDFLSEDDVAAFRKAGLSHMLALSGMHLAIIGMLATFFASVFLNNRSLKLFIIIASFMFLFFAGASPSLIRAFIMLSIIAIAKLLYTKVNLLGILAFSFSLHLLAFPEDAITLSFALSYLALFGILALGIPLYNCFNSYLPNVINSSISASLSATLVTAPLIAVTLKDVSFTSLLATCIVGPMVSIFLILGLIFLSLSLALPMLHNFLGSLLNLLYKAIINTVYFFAQWPTFKFSGSRGEYILRFLPLLVIVSVLIIKKLIEEEENKKLIIE